MKKLTAKLAKDAKTLFLNFFFWTRTTRIALIFTCLPTVQAEKPFKNPLFVRVFREIRVQKSADLDLRNIL